MANRTITIGMRDYDHCRALADGRPLKQWTYRPDMVPVYPGA